MPLSPKLILGINSDVSFDVALATKAAGFGRILGVVDDINVPTVFNSSVVGETAMDEMASVLVDAFQVVYGE